MDTNRLHPDTIAAQALGWIDEATRAVIPPLHVSTTYLRDPTTSYRSGRVYARADNPAFDQAEAVIAALEQGAQAALFASGMAAATAVFQALAPGDHVLAPKVMYWSLRNWLMNFATHWGLQVELVDMTDPARVEAAMRPGETRLVWVETPANPLWTHHRHRRHGTHRARGGRAAGGRFDRRDAADHAAARPGRRHRDARRDQVPERPFRPDRRRAGARVTTTTFWQRVRTLRAQLGGTLGSFEAWLLLRGMRTLHLRVRCGVDVGTAHRRALREAPAASSRCCIRG